MAAYDAFISYSHAKDKPVAAALQSAMQRLGKPWYRRRALRLFRDDTSLSATPGLWDSIERALTDSRYLVLLASPEAAASPWVTKEVTWWLAHKSADTLLIAVTDGTLAWDETRGDYTTGVDTPLPRTLAGRFAAEPKWVDLRAYRLHAEHRADLGDAKLTELAADLAAAIHGMPKEDLLSQEVRQQRKALSLALSATASLLVLAGVAGWQWTSAVTAARAATEQGQIAAQQRDRAEENFAMAKQAADDVVFQLAQDLRDVEGMPVQSVRKILDAARRLMDQVGRSAPDDPQLLRSRAAMLGELTETYMRIGDLTRAQAAAEEALTIVRRLVAAAPTDAQGQLDLFTILTRLGDAQLAAGNRTAALTSFEEAVFVMRKRAAADPGNALWQRNVSVTLDRIGDARFQSGNRAGALAAYEESLAIRRRYLAADPDSAEWQSSISMSLDKIGDLRLATMGDPAGALAAFEESLVIRRKLAAALPDNTDVQRCLSVTLDKVGQAKFAAGDNAGALTAYEEGLTIVRKLAASDPGKGSWQRDLSVSLERIGNLRLAMDDEAGALKVFDEALAIMRKLVAADPGNAGWQRDLSLSLNNVANIKLEADDPKDALVLFEESLTIRRKLAAADPDNLQWQRDVSTSLNRIGDAKSDLDDHNGARAAYEEALVIRRKLTALDDGNTAWQADLAVTLYNVGTVAEPPEAQAALTEAIAIVDTLGRTGKLTAAQRGWRARFLEQLGKLPTAAVR
jgi:tetratricopeptide (TPR) repeat protein